jgi:hypothetical protein
MVFQGLINGWVRVNQKHTVFPPQEEPSNHEGSVNGAVVAGSAHGKRNKDMNLNGNSNVNNKSFRKEQVSHGTATTAGTGDAETQAIKRFKNRSHNRKLKRTISHTDLLREMAKEKEMEAKQNAAASTAYAGSASQVNPAHTRSPPNQDTSPLTFNDEPPTEHSLRFVAGFFGADYDVQQNHSSQQEPQHRSKIPSKYLNENAFVQQFEHTKSKSQLLRTTSQDNSGSDASTSRRLVTSKQDANYFNDSSQQSHHSVGGPPASLRGTPPLPKESRINPINQFFRAFPHGRHHCGSCEELESRLLSTHADIEHLRSEAMRNEFICKRCECNPDQKTSATKTEFESKTLAETSKQLLTVTSRHKRQIEEMSKEQLRWQQNMQAKLSKMASMCEELNRESELRQHEAADLNQEMINTRAERDVLAAQVEELRAEAILFQREKLEHRQLREILHKYETEGLARAHDAIEQRDQVIKALSTRLERTLETLDMERQQQRQRRQIIFPSRSSLPGSLEYGSTSPNGELAALKEELRVAHEHTLQAKVALESTKAEANEVDEAWMARYMQLENEFQLLKVGRLSKDD